LRVIRENRLSSLGNKAIVGNEYTDLNAIKEEVLQARKFFHNHNISVIDITGKAIEETAGEIITLYFTKFGYT
ncbi:MAG: kinase/pyrophosphorylase, partial [Alphaproteobacteria bacterium]